MWSSKVYSHFGPVFQNACKSTLAILSNRVRMFNIYTSMDWKAIPMTVFYANNFCCSRPTPIYMVLDVVQGFSKKGTLDPSIRCQAEILGAIAECGTRVYIPGESCESPILLISNCIASTVSIPLHNPQI